MGSSLFNAIFQDAVCASDGHQWAKKADPRKRCPLIEVCDRCSEINWATLSADLVPLLDTARDAGYGAGLAEAGQQQGHHLVKAARDRVTEREREEAAMGVAALKVLRDLDRCPHGRHQGDACAGWRGPKTFDGGCQGGVSLGNPNLQPGETTLGYSLYANAYRVPLERGDRHDPRNWAGGR